MVEAKQSSSPTVTLQVELFGQARILVGLRQVEIAAPWQADRAAMATALARACPQLVGKVIQDDRSGLVESYIFNLNGTAFVGDEQMQLKAGDALLLFSSQAGG